MAARRRNPDRIVQIMHGSQTFRNTSSKVNVFAFNIEKVSGVQARTFPSTLMHVLGRPTKAPAARDQFADHGQWYTSRLEHEEGVILMVQATNTMEGRPYSGASCVVRLRAEAPTITVNAALPSHPNSVYNVLPSFVGNADRLTVKEAVALGCVFTAAYIDNYLSDEEEFDECWEVLGLNEGTSPKPTVEKFKTVTGETKAVVVGSQPRRRIRVRR